VGIDETGQNCQFAEILEFGVGWNFIWTDNLADLFALHEQGGWAHALRRHSSLGDEGAQTHRERRILASLLRLRHEAGAASIVFQFGKIDNSTRKNC